MLAPLGLDTPPVRLIDRRSSLRSRGLARLRRLLRWLGKKPLRHDDDISALRRRYEAIDARQVPVARTVRREAVQCNGVAAEWVRAPETRPGRTLLLHGGSFAFRFPNLCAAFAARLRRAPRPGR